MTRPLLSIITPTIPERHDLLMECIEDVRGQDYPNLEHIIVSDGPAPEVAHIVGMQRAGWTGTGFREYAEGHDPRPPIRFSELGRPWSPLLPPQSLGVAPLLAGMLQARGDLMMVLCDDERMEPDHLSKLAAILEAQGADFAYSMTRMYRKGSTPEQGWTIGTDPPEYGEITNCLFRADLLTRAMPSFDARVFNDWYLVSRWMEAGARWAFLPEVTLSHRADR